MYEAKCHHLGVVPSTQVMKHLKREDCRMDHVPLGREGAEALAQSLSVNNIITALSLSDCVLDSKVQIIHVFLSMELKSSITFGSSLFSCREYLSSAEDSYMPTKETN